MGKFSQLQTLQILAENLGRLGNANARSNEYFFPRWDRRPPCHFLDSPGRRGTASPCSPGEYYLFDEALG